MDDAKLKQLVGLADMCELLSALVRFPEDDLVRALVAGDVLADALGCCNDLDATVDKADNAICTLTEGLDASGQDVSFVGGTLRRAWSLLYGHQGSGVLVFPYESAFVHVRMGKKDAPALFRSKLTLDVEQAMRDAGGLPATYATEPCDSAWDELAFLSSLLGRAVSSALAEDEAATEAWLATATAFFGKHPAEWLPSFFRVTGEHIAALGEAERVDELAVRYYGAVADLGRYALAAFAGLA